MTSSALDDLIRRLSEAKTGSYELSWAVAQYLGWTKYWFMMTIYLPPGEIEDDPRRDDDNWTSGSRTDCPPFTTSIDAALTLYKTKPEKISTNPLVVCVEALKQWF